MALQTEAPILIRRHSGMMEIVLNRPRVLNVLNFEMVRLIKQALDRAQADGRVQLVLFSGAGDKAFCAGGDLKALARAVSEQDFPRPQEFFQEEYLLDLSIHQFPKAVMVLAHGITMGGGLGLAAGADIIVATEETRLAMPETRIGFFPDVGATGWLFDRCPPGYPEYLALTGYEMQGAEGVRLGLATRLVKAGRLPELTQTLTSFCGRLSPDKAQAVKELHSQIAPLAEPDPPRNQEMDAWVAENFAGKTSLPEIMVSLNRCSLKNRLCDDVWHRLSERSPTAMALTLRLLRANEGRPLPEVFAREARAARFMIKHPDYLEGIRARILDRDNQPRWRPASWEEVYLEVEL